MIRWREKFVAFGIHFAVTLAVAACAAALIFLAWYPDPFQEMLGGLKLFLLIVGCDLALGPLTSLVIYNSQKSRRMLLIDYAIVGVVQLTALVYGVHAVSNARPVYLAFAHDRIEVIAAGDIDPADLHEAAEEYRTLPKLGPKLVGVREAADVQERNQRIFMALAGKDVSVIPKYYVEYDSIMDQVKKAAKPLSALYKRHPEAQPLVQGADSLWVPVKHRKGFWTALLDPQTGRPVDYIPIDPY
jgi:hypothetical protein